MKRYKFDPKHIEVIFEDLALEVLRTSAQCFRTDHERAGLLLGRILPDENRIIVVEATSPSFLSSGITNVCIDLEDANKYMLSRWAESDGKITYVGDWHTHPEYRPFPSSTDRFTFLDTFWKSRVDQNLLLCAIIGMSPETNDGIWVGVQSRFFLHKLNRIQESNVFIG